MTRVDALVRVQIGHVAETFRAIVAAVRALLSAWFVARLMNLKRLLVRKPVPVPKSQTLALYKIKKLETDVVYSSDLLWQMGHSNRFSSECVA